MVKAGKMTQPEGAAAKERLEFAGRKAKLDAEQAASAAAEDAKFGPAK